MKYNISVNVNVEDGLANGTTGKVKFIEYKIEGSNHPSIKWMKFEDPRIGKATREKYFQRGFYNSNFQRDWTGLQYLKLKELFVQIQNVSENTIPIATSSGKNSSQRSRDH